MFGIKIGVGSDYITKEEEEYEQELRDKDLWSGPEKISYLYHGLTDCDFYPTNCKEGNDDPFKRLWDVTGDNTPTEGHNKYDDFKPFVDEPYESMNKDSDND